MLWLSTTLLLHVANFLLRCIVDFVLIGTLPKILLLVGVDRLLHAGLCDWTLDLTVRIQPTALTCILATARHLLINLTEIIELSSTNPLRWLITCNQSILGLFCHIVMHIIYGVWLLLLKLNTLVIASRSSTCCIMLCRNLMWWGLNPTWRSHYSELMRLIQRFLFLRNLLLHTCTSSCLSKAKV